MKIQDSIKAEVVRIAKGTIIGTVIMWAAFIAGHMAFPEIIPLGYQIFLAGAAGAAVAIGNFVGLAVMVQQIADDPDPEKGKKRMRSSYSRRMLVQALWVVAAVKLPVFHWAAGVLPLLFPRVTIFFLQIMGKYGPELKGGEA